MHFSTAKPEWQREKTDAPQSGTDRETVETGKATTKQTIIEHLEINPDLNRMKDLKTLFALIDELKAYVDSNHTETDPEPQPT